ncbi:hypothetical protein [Singulisphaera acidiphila]|nr:hypothetical protein [Singulisphaera acidiphila]
MGQWEPLAGHPGRYLLTVGPAAADPSQLLDRIRTLLGDETEVQPLLWDEKGEPKIPTGQVLVRFKRSPSDQELKAFAEPLGLAVEQRNDYIPSQVSFRPAKGAKGSVDELIERIREDDDLVQRVWPETLGTYRRE